MEKEVLEIIVTEFPQLNDQISELFYESTSFIELCEDYALCLNSIKKLESVKRTVEEKELIDLRMVLLNLKEEILSRFEK